MKNAIICCFGAGMLMSSAANAAEPLGTMIASQTDSPVISLPVVNTLHNAELQPLSEADLGSYRGGETIVVGNQTLKAITSGNILNGNFVAGSVTLSDNALSNFNGIGNFAINTGAQVSLQSGMNLTINVGQ